MEATVKVIDWKSLGLSLGIPISMIDRIEVDCHRAKDCQRHMLQHWLNTGNASWAALVAALKSQLISMNGLADTIAKEHPGKLKSTKSYIQHLDCHYKILFTDVTVSMFLLHVMITDLHKLQHLIKMLYIPLSCSLFSVLSLIFHQGHNYHHSFFLIYFFLIVISHPYLQDK